MLQKKQAKKDAKTAVLSDSALDRRKAQATRKRRRKRTGRHSTIMSTSDKLGA